MLGGRQVTKFDSIPVNGITEIRVGWGVDNSAPRVVSVSEMEHRQSWATFDTVKYEPWEFTLTISSPTDRGLTTIPSTWKTNVENYFQPWKTKDGLRTLTGVNHDASTEVYLSVEVLSLEMVADTDRVGGAVYQCVMRAPNPIWRSTTEQSDNSSPINNAGTARTPTKIELTTSTHKKKRAVTVAGNGAGGGLLGYPIKISYTEAGMVAGEVFAYPNGVNAPTLSDDYTAYIWVLCDTAADSSISSAIDVICADSVDDTNVLGGRLLAGGMKLTDATSGTDSTNTSWTFNDFTISQNPDRCGCWRPTVTGTRWSSGKARITAEGASLTFSLNSGGSGDFEADSMALTIGATGSSLANFSRQGDVANAENSSCYVRGRTYGSVVWVDIWTITADATVTASITVTNYTELLAGIQNDSTPNGNQSLIILGAGTGGCATLSLANNPTVTVPASTNVDYYDGTITNSTTGEYIQFESVMADDGTLTIDSENKTVDSSAGYTNIYGAISFSDPDNWIESIPGDNTMTASLTAGASVNYKLRSAWA